MQRVIFVLLALALGCDGKEEAVEDDGSCEVDGEVYENGEQVGDDDYHPCTCEDGDVTCLT